MAWVKLDDGFYDHPKFADVGALGIALWAAGLAYCNRHMTDGRIPTGHMRRLVDLEGASPDEVAGRLVKATLWSETPDGYEVVGYLVKQRSAEQIKDTSTKRQAAGKQGGTKRAANLKQSASKIVPEVEEELEQETPQPPSTEPGTGLALVKPSARPVPFADEFELLWKRYPRKVDKADALAAYQARRRQGVTAAELLAAVVHYAAQRDGQNQAYTKHGATFLAKDGAWLEWRDGAPEDAAPAPPRADTKVARSMANIERALSSGREFGA